MQHMGAKTNGSVLNSDLKMLFCISSLLPIVHMLYEDYAKAQSEPAPSQSPDPLDKIAALPVPGVRPVFFLAASSTFSSSMFFTYASISSTGNISMVFPGAIIAISIFFAPVCTTSSNDLMVSLIVVSRSISSLWFRSKNSRTVLLDRPIAFAFLLNESIYYPPEAII